MLQQAMAIVLLAAFINSCDGDRHFDSRSVEKKEPAITLGLGAGKHPIAFTSHGTLFGNSTNHGLEFLGIPYAAPPIDHLRFVPAQPPAAWFVRESRSYGNRCPEVTMNGDTKTVIGHEDCLYLNVWTPSTWGKRPVMVFIHGGGGITGTASGYDPFGTGDVDLYDGGKLSKLGDTVVVNFNYRLGILGFLATPELVEEGHGSAGNYALSDVLQALAWIKKNAKSFGGDPDNIMLFGESFGSTLVCAALATAQAKSLVSKAAMQSLTCTSQTLEAALEKHAEVLETPDAFTGQTAIGYCSRYNGAKRLRCMRRLPVERLVKHQSGAAVEVDEIDIKSLIAGNGEFGGTFDPVVDGRFLKEAPRQAIKYGRHARVPIIIGNTADEASLPLLLAGDAIPESFVELHELFRQIPLIRQREVVELSTTYSAENFADVKAAFVGFATDIVMTCHMRSMAMEFAAWNDQVFRYIFESSIPGYFGLLDSLLGAFHGVELFYLFQNINDLPLDWPTYGEKTLERNMGLFWTSFAKSSVPTHVRRPLWKPVTENAARTLAIGDKLKMVGDYRAKVCKIIARLGDT